MTEEVTFYVVSDERFFIGAVGLINSLRLMGHEQRVVVLDCGMTERQREVLASECELASPPDSRAGNPQLLKPFANLMSPKGIVVILDSDLIVTRPLDPMLQAASGGRVCACSDPESDRWFADWEQIFGCRAPPRRQTYVSSGFVAFSTEYWPDLLPRWWDSCQRIRSYPTAFYGAPDSPTAQADQDALNAILMGELPEEVLAVQPREVQPSMEQLRWHVRVLNVDMLSCSMRNRAVTLIHPGVMTKPFETQWWLDQGQSPYPVLLRRLLVKQDIRIRVDRESVPIWLQSGWLGSVMVRTLRLVNGLGRIRRQLRRWRLLRWAYKFVRGRLGRLLG